MIWLTNHGRYGHPSPFTLLLKGVQFKSSFHVQHHLHVLCHLWYKKCTCSLIQLFIYLFSTICVTGRLFSTIRGCRVARKICQIFVIMDLKQGKNDTSETMSVSIQQNITELLRGFQIKVPDSEKRKEKCHISLKLGKIHQNQNIHLVKIEVTLKYVTLSDIFKGFVHMLTLK